MSRVIGGNIGFIAWQKPVTMKELVQVMFDLGMSQQETVARLSGRCNPVSVQARWKEAYRNRPRRAAVDWRPRMLPFGEARP